MLEIKIQGYSWNTNVKDASFFNPLDRGTAFTPNLDFWDYIKIDETPKLEWEREELDIGDKSVANYILPREMNFEISGIDVLPNGQTVSDFFLMKQDKSLVRYKVQLVENNLLFWEGIVSNENTEYVNSLDDSDQTLRVMIYGFERELMEYYKPKKLPEMQSVVALNLTDYAIPFFNENNNQGQQMRYAFLNTFLRLLFDNNFNVMTPGNWIIMERPHFAKVQNRSNLIWFQNGYRKVYEDEENIFNFFIKILNSMGWIFSFDYVGGVRQMIIKNRADEQGTIIDITSDEIQHLENKHTSPHPTVASVVLTNGTYFGGTDGAGLMFGETILRGQRCIVITDVATTSLAAHHISDVNPPIGISPTNYNIGTYQPFSQVVDNNNEYFEYYYSSGRDPFTNPPTVFRESFVLNKWETLMLNVGENKVSVQVDSANKFNFNEPGGEGMSGTAMSYTGNYGSMLGYFQGNEVVNYYRWVLNENQFINNYQKLMRRNDNISCMVKIDRMIKNTNFRVRINDVYGSKIFNPRLISVDLFREETTLELE